MTRNLLEKRMQLLTSELAEMGSLVEKQLYNSIEAFKNKDMVLAKKVIENDDKVDELNKKIEEQCLKFMAMAFGFFAMTSFNTSSSAPSSLTVFNPCSST